MMANWFLFKIPRNLLEIVDKILDHLSTFTFIDTYLRIHSFQQMQTPDYIAGFLFSSMKHFKMVLFPHFTFQMKLRLA